MAKPQEKTSSTAARPIAPPPLSDHLRDLASRPDAWAVIARNLIPVVGIYGFGWSAALAVFNYWFDGLTMLAAIVAVLIPRTLRETQPKSVGAMSGGGEPRARRSHVDFPGRHRWYAVLDRADSASRSAAWQRTATPARAFAGTLAHLRRARGRTFLEGVPIGL